jgi:hypothetical protein
MRKHLILNQYRLLTAEDIATEIEEYCDALEEAEQSAEAASSSIVAPIAPGKGGAKGKSKGKPKGDGKGKLHKGLGKSVERGEQRRFGGQCHWCWRLGHKEDACWFKQAFVEAEKAAGRDVSQYTDKKSQKGAGKGGEGKKGQQDIRNYLKRPREETGSSMDVGAVTAEPTRASPSSSRASASSSSNQGFMFGVNLLDSLPEEDETAEYSDESEDAEHYPEDYEDEPDDDDYDDDDSEKVRCVFGLSQRDHDKYAKPMIDSGSYISTCPQSYDPHRPTVQAKKKLNLESVLGEALNHVGTKYGVV